MSREPESLILRLLRDMRAEMSTKADVSRLDNKIDDLRSDLNSLRADVASDLLDMEARQDMKLEKVQKHLGDQIVGLRRAVVEYHTSVIGHGILISEREA